jgi:cyclopropane fatty-acyl-phospholipid synthase-like methyltransferase
VTSRPNAPAAERNREPILEVLRTEFGDRRSVLEIGSGTGQHAVWLGPELSHLVWQTSERPGNLAGVRAWVGAEGLVNVPPPIELDAASADVPSGRYDAVFSANTVHIMSIDVVRAMFGLVGRVLPRGGKFCLYGPFNMQGEFTSDSNRLFDASLRARDPSMGIRDIEMLDQFAESAGLVRTAVYAMPANNFCVVWVRS